MSSSTIYDDESESIINDQEDLATYPIQIRWTRPCNSVSLTGSFNDWADHILLEEQNDVFSRGTFYVTTLNVKPGIYSYKFLVDGEWKYDPEVAFTTDQFGNINNVIEVSPSLSTRPQVPTKSILRDTNHFQSSTMNQDAALVTLRLNEKSSSSPPKIPSPENAIRRVRSASEIREVKAIFERDAAIALMAAETKAFGGDLVTQEHQNRALSGGHRSLAFNTEKPASLPNGLIIFLVGLPGRGKTFIGNILCRHLTWMGHPTKLFNVGQYRRELIGKSLTHDFWDPNNAANIESRVQMTRKCLQDALASLASRECNCVVFDATNCTKERRSLLRQIVVESSSNQHQMLFVESILKDKALVDTLIHEMKFNSSDYADSSLVEARKDYYRRIQHYEEIYESLDESEDNTSFIKVVDAGRQLMCNEVYGFLPSRIVSLLTNFHLNPRPIWLSRHGQSQFNVENRIGGDSGLSPLGKTYACQLDAFMEAHYPSGESQLSIWTSTMQRTGMTVQRLAERGRTIIKWKQLDEIDAGVCDGMTYTEVEEEMPHESQERKKNKLHYRYPRGESYQDVIHRLEPVITELMRQRTPILIVAHQAILRVLYGYLTNKRPCDCPTIDMPLHKVIQVTPKAYKCEEVWHSPM